MSQCELWTTAQYGSVRWVVWEDGGVTRLLPDCLLKTICSGIATSEKVWSSLILDGALLCMQSGCVQSENAQEQKIRRLAVR